MRGFYTIGSKFFYILTYFDETIECLRILLETFKEDIPRLHAAEKNNGLEDTFIVLCKIYDCFRFSGTPRLEKTFKILYEKVKLTSDLDLRKMSSLFLLAYDEVEYFEGAFAQLINKSDF